MVSLVVIVIGDACSGKTTLLDHLRSQDIPPGPNRKTRSFPSFSKSSKQYAYHNQLYKTAQLMEQELQAAESPTENRDPV